MEQSIVRHIISYRLLNRMSLIFNQKSIHGITHCSKDIFDQLVYDYYESNVRPHIGHTLIKYVWFDIFETDIKHNAYYFHKITYKNNTIQTFATTVYWNIIGKNDLYINLFDYVTSTASAIYKDLQFISDSIDDYEKDLIKKILLIKHISSECVVDVTDLISRTYLKILLLQ